MKNLWVVRFFNLLQFTSPMSAEPGSPAPVHPKWESLLLVRIWHIGAWHSVSAQKVVTVTKMFAVVMTSGTEYFKKEDERKYLIWWVRRKDLWRHVSFKGIIPTENDVDVCRWAPWVGAGREPMFLFMAGQWTNLSQCLSYTAVEWTESGGSEFPCFCGYASKD